MTSKVNKIQRSSLCIKHIYALLCKKGVLLWTNYPFPHLWEDKGLIQSYPRATVNTNKQVKIYKKHNCNLQKLYAFTLF